MWDSGARGRADLLKVKPLIVTFVRRIGHRHYQGLTVGFRGEGGIGDTRPVQVWESESIWENARTLPSEWRSV